MNRPSADHPDESAFSTSNMQTTPDSFSGSLYPDYGSLFDYGDDLFSSDWMNSVVFDTVARRTTVDGDQLPDINDPNNGEPICIAPPTKSRKGKAPTLRLEDWELVKSRVLDLHVTQNIPLPKVIQTIEEEYPEFKATLRISQWGQDKNVKPSEMKVIVRKRQQRKINDPNRGELRFRLREHTVDPEKIDRWMKRKNIASDEVYSPSSIASTPTALSFQTRSPASGSMASISMSRSSSFNQGLEVPSPALSFASVFQSRASSFPGQSPALSYRKVTMPQIFVNRFGPIIEQASTQIISRYLGEDESRTREELSFNRLSKGDEHPKTMNSIICLAEILLGQGRYRSAEEIARESVVLCKAHLGEEHELTLNSLFRLGVIFRCQGLFEKAEKLQRKILSTSQRVLGQYHKITLVVMLELVHILYPRSKWNEAETFAISTLRHHEKALGARHLGTLEAKLVLAIIYTAQYRLWDAEQLQMSILQTSIELVGPENIFTIISMASMANIYHMQGRLSEAEQLATRALETSRRVLGPEHPQTMESIKEYATICNATGRGAEANKLLERCVAVQERVLGLDHPKTIHSASVLSSWKRMPQLLD
ncbi:TPR-like protein [Microthyrium microscopicum]|uniref:TPR-like protein n=1 Tax=Microthyrium microscopicum TaxID=703497 RepID=A0A6A6U843_9PEZI|nr:TPR-like protein [Microthyrium microscopicum]